MYDSRYGMYNTHLQAVRIKERKPTDILQKREMLGAYLCVVIIYQNQRQARNSWRTHLYKVVMTYQS